MKLHNIFLAGATLFFGFSLTEFGAGFAYGIFKPLGAVLFVLFMIWKLLDGESAKYVEEQREMMRLLRRPSESPTEPRQDSNRSEPIRSPHLPVTSQL